MKLAIVGPGNMGRAIYERLKTAKLCGPGDEIHEEAVLFAIKPQSFDKWGTPLPSSLIISIMAGISLEKLQEKTGSKKVIRSMPNLALKVGQSVTGWCASLEVTDEEKAYARSLFSKFGYELELDHEEKLNALTAISGSGPGYFFHFCDEMIKKAEAFGFTPEEAKNMTEKTLEGALALLKEEDASTLLSAVASKGGTTQAALDVLNGHFSQALNAAKKRAEELA